MKVGIWINRSCLHTRMILGHSPLDQPFSWRRPWVIGILADYCTLALNIYAKVFQQIMNHVIWTTTNLFVKYLSNQMQFYHIVVFTVTVIYASVICLFDRSFIKYVPPPPLCTTVVSAIQMHSIIDTMSTTYCQFATVLRHSPAYSHIIMLFVYIIMLIGAVESDECIQTTAHVAWCSVFFLLIATCWELYS